MVNYALMHIIKNPKGRHYIGVTENLERSLEHNKNNKHYSGYIGLWELVIYRQCKDRI